MDTFCELQRELLELEYQAEVSESTGLLNTLDNSELQSKGIALLSLVVSEVKSGLFGKTIAVFSHHLSLSKKQIAQAVFAKNSISSSDIVGVFVDSFKTAPLLTGVVHDIDSNTVQVVLDREDDAALLWDSSRFNIAKIGSNVTHKRLQHTLSDLEKSSHPLIRQLYESDSSVGSHSSWESNPPVFVTQSASRLNNPQKLTVKHALANPLITVCQGPPGTGKTTTLAAFIAESVRSDPSVKILACAPSNVATDNLALKVMEAGVENIVRIGHPTRISSALLERSLDSLVERGDFAESCRDIKSEIQAVLNSRRGYAQLKELRKELKGRQSKSIEEVFRSSNVVFTTCVGAFNLGKKLGLPANLASGRSGGYLFDIAVVDECAQGLEVSSWIPCLQARRVVLGGDHKQLPPTIKSIEANSRGLGTTLFERCFERFAAADACIVNSLSIQYRMNSVIMGWSNREFYGVQLVAHASVADQTLEVPENADVTYNGVDLKGVIECPFVFCDTVGVEGMEEVGGVSKSNPGEASVVKVYTELINMGERSIAKNVSIISPYMSQTELIRQVVPTDVEVSTVDSFQGRESDVIILSLVRANAEGQVGFLSDYRRLNVAITRAQRQVFVVGDSETISSDKVLGSLFQYACDEGMVISAESLVDSNGRCQVLTNALANKVHAAKSSVKPKSKPEKPGHQVPVHVQSIKGQEDRETANAVSEAKFLAEIESLGVNQRFSFPATLSNADRRVVHAICERFGYSHGSTGEGFERHVWVEKKQARPIKAESTSAAVNTFQPVRAESDSESLHDEPQVVVRHGTAPLANPKLQKANRAPAAVAPIPKPAGVCAHLRCPMSTKLISLSCSCCGKDFCIPHSMPEVHGCADAIRKNARKDIKDELKRMKNPSIIAASGKGGVSTEAVRNKMKSKMKDLKGSRTATPSTKK